MPMVLEALSRGIREGKMWPIKYWLYFLRNIVVVIIITGMDYEPGCQMNECGIWTTINM